MIEYSDLIRDLRNWETLLLSTFMQRPYQVLTEDMSDEIREASHKNLQSALAYAALTLKQKEI